jgi:hypothetical protein
MADKQIADKQIADGSHPTSAIRKIRSVKNDEDETFP